MVDEQIHQEFRPPNTNGDLIGPNSLDVFEEAEEWEIIDTISTSEMMEEDNNEVNYVKTYPFERRATREATKSGKVSFYIPPPNVRCRRKADTETLRMGREFLNQYQRKVNSYSYW